MVINGKWYPDYPGQQPYQDPEYMRQTRQGWQESTPPNQTRLARGEYYIVPSEDVARNHYVAPGDSATFINPAEHYFYIKKAGKSPVDIPKLERYRLVYEEDPPAQPVAAPTPAPDLTAYATKADIDAIRNDMTLLKAQIDAVAYQPASATPGGDDNGQPSPEWH